MQWLVRAFWRLCGGVFTADLSHNKFQYVYSALLLATCVHNFLTSSNAMCRMGHWCDIFSSTVLEIYDRVLASTIFFSRIAVLYRGDRNVSRYRASVSALELYSPTSAAELRLYQRFSSAVVSLCLAMTVPITVGRLYYLYAYDAHASQLIYFLFLNVQNLSMCCVETQFVTQCFEVYVKFREINGELRRLNEENVNRAEHPFETSAAAAAKITATTSTAKQFVRYDRDFYAPLIKSDPMANVVEILRIKHWLIRQSADTLNNLFGVHMGLSVFYLWGLTLFDMYYKIFDKNPSQMLIYGWLLQYSLRLLMIILMAHYTTKQALRSKSLIADINSGILEDSTKEELFLNQIHCSSTEFTAYDFFTLNTQIIKSVVAAAATYLVILVQLRSF